MSKIEMSSKRVFVVRESDLEVMARFDTIQEAEQWIAEREKIEPDFVHSGAYGIDAPEEML